MSSAHAAIVSTASSIVGQRSSESPLTSEMWLTDIRRGCTQTGGISDKVNVNQTVAGRTCARALSSTSMLPRPPRTRLRADFHPLRLVTANSFGRALLPVVHGAALEDPP